MPFYPKAVLIAVFSLIVSGALLIWGSIFTLLGASRDEKVDALVFYTGVVNLILGIVILIAAWSLMKGKHWARLAIIILSVVSIFVGILSLSNSNFGSAIPLFIYGYVIVLMNTRNVKNYLSNRL